MSEENLQDGMQSGVSTEPESSLSTEGASEVTSGGGTILSAQPEHTQAEGEAAQSVQGEQGAPETYDLALPQGMELQEGQVEMFKAQAKELGLTNEQANKMLELSQKNQASHQEAHQAQVAQWGNEVRMDKELGGAAYESTVAYAKAGLSLFDESGEVFKMLDSTGYGNNPHVIRFLSRLGKAHAEDKVVMGDAAGKQVPRHERLYGKYNS